MRLLLGCCAGVEQLGLRKPKTFVWWLNVRMTQLKFLMSYAVRKLNKRVACSQPLTAAALSRTTCVTPTQIHSNIIGHSYVQPVLIPLNWL